MIEKVIISIFTSLPVPVSLVMIVFLFLFRNQIGYFIANKMTKMGPSGIEGESGEVQLKESDQVRVEKSKEADTQLELQAKEKDLEAYKSIVQDLLKRVRIYEFAYLNLFLVHNSKFALWWFYQQASITKEVFINTFPIPPEITDAEAQKEIIFSVLLSNELIVCQNSLCLITDKGKDFLRHIGFIKDNV